MTPPETPAEVSREVLEVLEDSGLPAVEVYLKEGRSRRLEITPATELSGFHQEEGWAVRAGGGRASFFACGTGRPRPEGPWPEPDGRALRLPEADAVAPDPRGPFREPAELDAPLVGEREGLEVLRAIHRELHSEMAGVRLLHGLLEDGHSTSHLRSNQGVEATWRHRVAALRLTAAGRPVEKGPVVSVEMALMEREGRRFHPKAVARRLADRLAVRGAPPPERDRGELLLAPPVGRRLLALLLPLLQDPKAAARVAGLRDRSGRLGSDVLTVVDDGRLPGGLLATAADGEGMPSREVVLIERGSFRQPLLAWHQHRGTDGKASGCARRASFRDLPRPGPTHLYLRAGSAPVGELLAEVTRGYYFLDSPGAAHLEPRQDRFVLPVAGFAVERGRAIRPVGRAVLTGSLGGLLRNLHAAGRDLAFSPEREGLLGAPTLLVSGVEVRPAG